MQRHQSRCWPAAVSGLNGNAKLASMSGKRLLQRVFVTVLVVLTAVTFTESSKLSPLLTKLSLLSWLSGTMSAMRRRASTPIGSPWICSCCPRRQPHRWRASPRNRITNGTGCPACAGLQAHVCNSLGSLFPSLAAEFDLNLNDCVPSEVSAWSSKKVWWRNAKCGSWRQAVHLRTRSIKHQL